MNTLQPQYIIANIKGFSASWLTLYRGVWGPWPATRPAAVSVMMSAQRLDQPAGQVYTTQ